MSPRRHRCLLRDRVAHVGGVRRAVDLGHLEVYVSVEPAEQPLARTQNHRSRRDDQLVDFPRRQRLPNHVGAATDGNVAVSPAASAASANAASRPETNRKPVSAAGWSAVRCVSTNRVPGNGLVPPHPPEASYTPRPTTPDASVETSSS